MPTVLCPHCGTKVTFEGLATVCPNCALVVRAGDSATSPRIDKIPPPPLPKKTVRVSDIEQVAEPGQNVFDPTPIGPPPADHTVLYVSAAAVAVLLIASIILLFIYLTHPSSTPVTPAPPPTIAQAPAPPPATAPVVEVVVPPTSTTVPITPAVAPVPWLNLKPVRHPVVLNGKLTDQSIGDSIQRGVNFLTHNFVDDELVLGTTASADYLQGADALCVYALLHAGTAINDPRLFTNGSIAKGLLDHLRKLPMTTNFATYARSLRATALALFDRPEDRAVLKQDLDWLVAASVDGAYTYKMPEKGTKSINWDNSNSQYGVLGAWAASETSLKAGDVYWEQVEKHWLHSQYPDGGWSYEQGAGSSTLTMTAAGITSLSVAMEEHSNVAPKSSSTNNGIPTDKPDPLRDSIDRGIQWLAIENNINLSDGNRGYALYAMERAGLASGIKQFGKRDWFREFASDQIRQQSPDGSWGGSDGALIETAFRLLFLARGRQPIFVNKLRFSGQWNNRPREAARLVEFASGQLEQQFAWGVADLSQDWSDWLDCPVLLITTDAPPDLSDDVVDKLRQFIAGGGLIVIHNEWETPEMSSFASELSRRLFPDHPLSPLPANHPIFTMVFPVKERPPLQAVSNGDRLLLVYCPTDITRGWVARRGKDSNWQSQLGVNICVYASGLDGFRRRVESTFLPPPDFKPIGTIPIARITYTGNWDPEPLAWTRFGRWFQGETSLALDVQPTPIDHLRATQAPVAVLTGNAAASFDQTNLQSMRDFVNDGGVLLIDSTGGGPTFIQSVRDQLIPAAFQQAALQPLLPMHPVLMGGGDCMDALPQPRLRRFSLDQLKGTPPVLDYFNFGKGTVIVSDLDLTDGLLAASSFGINGYTPSYSESFVKNVILWCLSHYHS